MGIVKIKKANIGDQVFTQLKDQIINGEWRPGDRIPSEAQLIQLFGVSRGTVRQAVQKLAGEGLIVTRHGEGSFVQGTGLNNYFQTVAPIFSISEDEMEKIFEFRQMFESGVAEVAATKATEAPTAATQPATEAPTEPPATEPAAPSCTVSISCTTVLDNWDKLSEAKRSIGPSNGIILGTVTVELQEGDTVFSVLQRVVSDYNIQMEYSVSPLYQTTYIEGLGNLYEKDCGARSGWMFAVNGVFPNYGASDCTVQDGDSIRWLYTCDLGSDLS